MYRLGIDVGGTFTDFVIFDEDTGRYRVEKTASTPKNPALGLLNGLDKAGINMRDVSFVSHASTVGTNALISGQFEQAGFITTKGFRDILEVGDGSRPDPWDPYKDRTKAYIRRRNVLEVQERMNFEGKVLIPLNEEDVRRACRIFKRRGIKSIGVAFFNSFMNGKHEARAKEIVGEEMPDAFCCTSYEIDPEIFEHQRFSTTEINTVLAPVVSGYLNFLDEQLKKRGYRGDLLVVHSGAGLMTAGVIGYYASRIGNSGPCAGVLAGAYIGKEVCGFPNVLTLDMGGTSTDVSTIYQGNVKMIREWHVEYGHPIRFPSVEVLTIGAGGGSIAWQEAKGGFRVGPQSQGADPGPACYVSGGDKATITDANLILGRLNPDMLLAGEVRINKEASEKVVGELGERFNMGLLETAKAIIEVANHNMSEALRLMSTLRGYDPREFALVAYGGGGPMHAVDVARELNIPKVVVPLVPGCLSALGCLLIDIRFDLSRTIVTDLEKVSRDEVENNYKDMEKTIKERLREEKVQEDKIELMREMEIGYRGQWRALVISVPSTMPDNLMDLRGSFDKEHGREYDYSDPSRGLELHTLRVVGFGKTPKPRLGKLSIQGRLEDSLLGTRKVYDKAQDDFVDTKIYQRQRLVPRADVAGPAILEQYDSTIYIPSGSNGKVDDYGNLIIDTFGTT